jgi:hypothetical protein
MGLISRGIMASTAYGSPDSKVFELVTSTEVEHSERLTRYRKFMNFYRGKHWDHTRDINEPFVTVNYCRRFVDAQVNFLMKGGFTCTIPDDPATPTKEDDDREFVRLMLEKTWEYNRKELIGFEMAQMGSITGDVFVRVSWSEDDPIEPAHARIDVLPSQYVFPVFGGPHGVDRKHVSSVLVLFPRFKNGLDESTQRFGELSKKNVEWYGERWYRDKVVKYDPIYGEKVVPNPLGEIPIVHIPNYPVAGEFFGRSDLADIISLQREYNEKATDISDVINYHGSPVTIVKGAKLTSLERGPNRMWGLPENAEVENLSLNGELKSSLDYLDRMKKAMHEVGGVPEIALSSNINNRETGSSVSMRYMPMLESRQVKIQTYGMGIRLINRLIMKTTAIGDADFGRKFDALNKSNKYRNEVVFPSPLPRDESIELDRSMKRMDLGLTSKQYEMMKMGFSQREIEKIKEDVKREKQDLADLELEIGQKFMGEDGELDVDVSDIISENTNRTGGNPNPKRPNPDVQAEKRSSAALGEKLDG